MLVKDVMQAHPVTATIETRLPDLVRLLQRRGYRHLPVLDGGKLAGIISDRDIKQSMTSAALISAGRERDRVMDELTAGQIMTRTVVTIGPMFGVEEAARIMVERRISALPVTEGDRLVGLVTETDVLRLFVRAMGALEPSSRVDVVLDDPDATLGQVVRALEEAGTRVASVMTLRDRDGRREIILRLATIDPGRAVAAVRAAGFSVRE